MAHIFLSLYTPLQQCLGNSISLMLSAKCRYDCGIMNVKVRSSTSNGDVFDLALVFINIFNLNDIYCMWSSKSCVVSSKQILQSIIKIMRLLLHIITYTAMTLKNMLKYNT